MTTEISFDNLPSAVSSLHEKLNRLETVLLEKLLKPQADPDEVLTVDQCAKFLSLSKHTVYAMIRDGELPVLKRSKRCYFIKGDLIKYLKEGRRKTLAEIKAELPEPQGKRKRSHSVTINN